MNRIGTDWLALTILAFTSLLPLAQPASAQNLLADGSFETGSVGACDSQGLLPPDWFQANAVIPGADTYTYATCNVLDGITYPDPWGNFTAITAARDGERFVAGWSNSGGTEAFGTTLASPLVANKVYRISGYFVRSPTHFNLVPGFNFWLTSGITTGFPGTLLATLLVDPPYDNWNFASIEFTAPNSTDQNFIIEPIDLSTKIDDSYIGTDAWRLVDVDSEPLVLDATPPAVASGQTLQFTSCGGGVGASVMFVLTGANALPLFVPLAFGTFDVNQTWRLKATVPPGLSGISVSFNAFGILPSGKLAETTSVDVDFL